MANGSKAENVRGKTRRVIVIMCFKRKVDESKRRVNRQGDRQTDRQTDGRVRQRKVEIEERGCKEVGGDGDRKKWGKKRDDLCVCVCVCV